MARPSRRRRREEEEEEEDERGRRGRGKPAAGGPNVAMFVMIGAVVVLGIVGVVLASGKEKKPAPKPVELKPVEVKKAPVVPTEEPPKPLTPAENAEVEAVFERAATEMEEFRRLAREGWDLKEKDDESGANDRWVEAKQQYKKVQQIVNEVIEDEDRFPDARQKAYMNRWLNKLSGWAKEASNIGKVHDR